MVLPRFEEFAARARLPLALSEILEYVTYCLGEFLSRLGDPKNQAQLLLPRFPRSVVEPIQNSVRFSHNVDAKKIAKILMLLQEFEDGIGSISRCKKKELIYMFLIKGLNICNLACDLMRYGEILKEDLMNSGEAKKVNLLLDMLGFTREKNAELFVLLERRTYLDFSGLDFESDLDNGDIDFPVGLVWKTIPP
jgi:hypothetical protein